ncbi:hypothetical protein [Abyssalbus ytuae]|uniref:Uncharacterized protein n=1 Tax=Abyssalbus ytuae TaxID=2926907 RepID=A0A9E6ZMK5_9FLAO|nr:hypothetical protein [Abyssalbus ytuae]UOB17075.1 hypothetical protein MQE35_15205 [Abyssalbus ytuae]
MRNKIADIEYPRVLTIDDYPAMQKSDALFARKINQNKDREIVNKIFGDLNGEIQ